MSKPYQIMFTRQAFKDFKTLTPKLQTKLKGILMEIISKEPYSGKRLLGELKGNYSYRLNLKDRIVYAVDERMKQINIKRVRTHYGE